VLSVALQTLTLTVQTVRMSTLPVHCKQRLSNRPIPRPGNRTKNRLRKKGGVKNCDELSGRRRRRRRTNTRRREDRENEHQEGWKLLMSEQEDKSLRVCSPSEPASDRHIN